MVCEVYGPLVHGEGQRNALVVEEWEDVLKSGEAVVVLWRRLVGEVVQQLDAGLGKGYGEEGEGSDEVS